MAILLERHANNKSERVGMRGLGGGWGGLHFCGNEVVSTRKMGAYGTYWTKNVPFFSKKQ